jgi:hypothetical protein
VTMPQGYKSAGNAYTESFDRIVNGFVNKTKCVDDSLLWAKDIEESFWQTCRYLETTARNGIIMNPTKFVFAQKEVEFAGFMVGPKSVRPTAKMISAIEEFPSPKSITDIRAWFGLVNQVAPFFAARPTLQPFRELLKAPATGKKIYWDEDLEKLFKESKKTIKEEILNGIATFSLKRPTCLATDWSKEGMGFFLLQKKCTCTKMDPRCCPGGWQIVLAGSRFCTGAESRYAPVEGEAQAIVWALESTRHYTLGNTQLLVATDHKPLVKVFGDRSLGDISNPRLARLKEATLRWEFQVMHVPGVVNSGPDALSRRSAGPSEVATVYRVDPT